MGKGIEVTRIGTDYNNRYSPQTVQEVESMDVMSVIPKRKCWDYKNARSTNSRGNMGR